MERLQEHGERGHVEPAMVGRQSGIVYRVEAAILHRLWGVNCLSDLGWDVLKLFLQYWCSTVEVAFRDLQRVCSFNNVADASPPGS